MPLLKPEPFMEGLVNRMSKKRKRVTFEMSREQEGGVHMEFVKLFDDAGTILGQLAYTVGTEDDVTVMDWSPEAATVERLLRFTERAAKRKKAKVLKAELYMSDAKTTDKIEAMKANGWETTEVGRTGQRSSYTLVKKLRA
jgi:hypothetical protein